MDRRRVIRSRRSVHDNDGLFLLKCYHVTRVKGLRFEMKGFPFFLQGTHTHKMYQWPNMQFCKRKVLSIHSQHQNVAPLYRCIFAKVMKVISPVSIYFQVISHSFCIEMFAREIISLISTTTTTSYYSKGQRFYLHGEGITTQLLPITQQETLNC